MECKKLLDAVQNDFTKLISKGDLFPAGSAIYVKEIRKGIFLLVNMCREKENKPVQALIATFKIFLR